MDLDNYAIRRINADKESLNTTWKQDKFLKVNLNNKNFLDVGCASGSLSKIIQVKKGNYYGIDYNESFVNHCTKQKLIVKQCDIAKEKIPYGDNFFDVIYCSHVLEHLDSREQIWAFKEFSRVLKKGGLLFLFAPTPYHWYFFDDETHVRACTHGQLTNLGKDSNLTMIEARYSNIRFFPNKFQSILRLPPMRWFLWEVYYIGKKNG